MELLARAARLDPAAAPIVPRPDAGRAHVDLLTIAAAAEMLCLPSAMIRDWIAGRCIPFVELPPKGRRRQCRIPMQGLLGSLEGHCDLRGALREQHARMRAANLTED